MMKALSKYDLTRQNAAYMELNQITRTELGEVWSQTMAIVDGRLGRLRCGVVIEAIADALA